MLSLRPPSSTHVSTSDLLDPPEYDPPVKQGTQHTSALAHSEIAVHRSHEGNATSQAGQ